MGCGGSKDADASAELCDVDPLVVEEALKQATEAVHAAARAAEAAEAGAQKAAEAARAAAAAAALTAEAAGPAAAAAVEAFLAAQDGRPPLILPLPTRWTPSPREIAPPRVLSRAGSLNAVPHRTHDEGADEFEDEPDTPDESEVGADDDPLEPTTPITPLPPPAAAHTAHTSARNGFKPWDSSSTATVPPVTIRDQARRALLPPHACTTRSDTYTHARARAHIQTHNAPHTHTTHTTHTHTHAHAHTQKVVGSPSRTSAATLLHCCAPHGWLRSCPVGPDRGAGCDLGGRATVHARAGGGHGGAA